MSIKYTELWIKISNKTLKKSYKQKMWIKKLQNKRNISYILYKVSKIYKIKYKSYVILLKM